MNILTIVALTLPRFGTRGKVASLGRPRSGEPQTAIDYPLLYLYLTVDNPYDSVDIRRMRSAILSTFLSAHSLHIQDVVENRLEKKTLGREGTRRSTESPMQRQAYLSISCSHFLTTKAAPGLLMGDLIETHVSRDS